MDGGEEGREEGSAGNPFQRTPEWHREREGKLTASAFGEAVGFVGSRQRLFRRLKGFEVFEGNPATQYGTEHEPIALAAYTARTGVQARLTGFHTHPEIEWLGGSPDALGEAVDQPSWLVEIKCPFSQKPYDTVPQYYMAQVQGLLEITDLPRCDLVVWTPTLLRIFGISRSREYWLWLYPKLAEFWSYYLAEVEPARQTKEQFSGDLVVNCIDIELGGSNG